MLVDKRRIQGPESSTDYRAYVKKKAKDPKTPVDKRPDGRSLNDPRRIFLKTGVITKAKGSSYIEQGRTKLMVGVYGPREIPRRSDFSMKGVLTCEVKFCPFSCRPRRGHQTDQEEKELGLIVKQGLESTVCLHLYPKACVDVFVTVIEDGGSVLAAAFTAAGLALADASINMFDVVIGSSVVLRDKQVVVDPTKEEEYRPEQDHLGQQRVQGNLTIGYLNNLEQVVGMVCEGEVDVDRLSAGMSTAIHQAQLVLPAVQQVLLEGLKEKKKAEHQP
jgi:exosome complex component MTR3